MLLCPISMRHGVRGGGGGRGEEPEKIDSWGRAERFCGGLPTTVLMICHGIYMRIYYYMDMGRAEGSWGVYNLNIYMYALYIIYIFTYT